MFGKKEKKLDYDRNIQKPVIRSSICTGEKTGCLKNIHTGKLEDIMLIRNEQDFDTFKKMCDVKEIETEY